MEPAEYLTNIISISNLAFIRYEYLVPRQAASSFSKKQLQKLEALWRQNGELVYRDPIRDRIWVFQNCPDSFYQSQQHLDVTDLPRLLTPLKVESLDILHHEAGVYEPSSLAQDPNFLNITRNTNNRSSPLTVSGNSIRKVQMFSASSTQSTQSAKISGRPSAGFSGAKSSGDKNITVSSKEIHECFISAVLGSMIYFLCRDDKFIPFNSRTLIATSSRPTYLGGCPNSIEFITLDVNLTTLGTLVIKASSERALRLRNLSRNLGNDISSHQFEHSASLWLAPTGCLAKFNCIFGSSLTEASGSSLVQAPSYGSFTDSVIKIWQSKCLEWLSYKGLDPLVLDAGGWVLAQTIGGYSPYSCVEIPKSLWADGSAIVPWPAMLCFQNVPSSFSKGHRKIDEKRYRDPLSFAEYWFTTRDERSSIISQRHKERQTAQLSTKEREEYAANIYRSHIFSPANLRRASMTGTVYPTPPDAPHPPNGLNTSNEDLLSSTNSINYVPPEIDANIPRQLNQPHTITEAWMSHEKRDSSSQVNFESYAEENNRYSGFSGDLFGTNITDADFNFFDEPGVVPMEIDASSLDSSSHTTLHETEIPEITSMQSSSKKNTADINSFQAIMPEQASKNTRSNIQADQNLNLSNQQKTSDILSSASTPSASLLFQPHLTNHLFTKETVFNKLKMELTNSSDSESFKRQSLYKKVNFSEALLSVNQKYVSRGRFDFLNLRANPHRIGPKVLPQTEYFRRKNKKNYKISEKVQLAQNQSYDELTPVASGPTWHSFNMDCDSQVSEDDDISLKGSNEDNHQALSKEGKYGEKETVASSHDLSAMECEQFACPQLTNDSFIPFIDLDPVDWPTVTRFTFPEPSIHTNTQSDLELIATAQILADQAIYGTFKVLNNPKNQTIPALTKSIYLKRITRSLETAAKKFLEGVHICSFQDFLEIQGIHVSNQVLRLPPRPNTNHKASIGAHGKLNNPFVISPPQLEVRRFDSSLSILPAAVLFWANLGLGPSSGGKDVEAACLYPDFDGIDANADIFLDRIRSVYETSKLGTHNRITGNNIQNGLVPFTFRSSQTQNSNQSPLEEATGELSRTLSFLSAQNKNLVIYFVYIDDDSTLLIEICSSFRHLLDKYQNTFLEKNITLTNKVVLQLIPLSFIASPSSLVLPLPSDYFRLALEVHDRCTDFKSSSSIPAIILERPLPKSIDFRLNSKPSASLLQENTCLHIAYAQSLDNRWITASWTDNRGAEQMNAAYCLGRKNKLISTSFAEVASEIWETTLEFISEKKIHWRLMIVKIGVMDSSEMSFWIGRASTETNTQISLTLLTTKTEPSLNLLPHLILKCSNGSSGPGIDIEKSTSLGSQPLAWSADNTSYPVDAPSELDADARLIDYTDQTWGAILSHRLNNSNSLVEIHLALISGYLIKRGGVNVDDPPVGLEVNIVYSEVAGNPRTYHENLLKEILGHYRGLGTLARVRGTVDVMKDVRPWHVAAAEKAVKALYLLI